MPLEYPGLVIALYDRVTSETDKGSPQINNPTITSKGSEKMKKLFAVACLLTIASCAMGPHAQNPDEYIHAFRASSNMFVNSLKKTDEFQVPRAKKAVLADVADLAQTCIHGKVVRSQYQEGTLVSSSDVLYSARVETTPAGRSVFALQVKNLNGSTVGEPADGMYMMAAEFDAVADDVTAINFYYPPGASYQSIVDAIKAWSRNSSGNCPNLG